jgi:UDPglucose--hexose-1-phosphate uridylyltransferase
MLLDYASQEIHKKERVVVHGEHFVVVVPYWAVWPFETMLLPYRRHVRRIDELNHTEIDDLACTMKRLLVIYDNLFKCQVGVGWEEGLGHVLL